MFKIPYSKISYSNAGLRIHFFFAFEEIFIFEYYFISFLFPKYVCLFHRLCNLFHIFSCKFINSPNVMKQIFYSLLKLKVIYLRLCSETWNFLQNVMNNFTSKHLSPMWYRNILLWCTFKMMKKMILIFSLVWSYTKPSPSKTTKQILYIF